MNAQPTLASTSGAIPAHLGSLAKGGFFSHHGPWAPGVRLFRTLQFRAKAAIVSALFLVPIVALSIAMLQSSREQISFAEDERAGVHILRALMPVFESVLEVRNATRAGLGGYDTAKDYALAREKADKAIAGLKTTVAAMGDPIALTSVVLKLDAAWRATADSKNGADDKGRTVFGPVTASLVELLTRVGDDSKLVLDPQLDTFYLVNAMVLAMPAAAEDLGQVWGWGTFALAKGGLDEKGTKRFAAWSSNADTKLQEARSYFDRAIKARPDLKGQLDLATLWPQAPRNVCFVFDAGNRDAVEQALAQAKHKVSVTYPINRITAVTMEPRTALGGHDPVTDAYTLHCGLQNPHAVRESLANDIFRISGNRVRVVSPDVGGGFGLKEAAFPEYVLTLVGAKLTGRTVLWAADRGESQGAREERRAKVGGEASRRAKVGGGASHRARSWPRRGGCTRPGP